MTQMVLFWWIENRSEFLGWWSEWSTADVDGMAASTIGRTWQERSNTTPCQDQGIYELVYGSVN